LKAGTEILVKAEAKDAVFESWNGDFFQSRGERG
jgi:hypothetical protein